MALTYKTNGRLPANVIEASWWNDFIDLLTGIMTDQPVHLGNTLQVDGIITATEISDGTNLRFDASTVDTYVRCPTSTNVVRLATQTTDYAKFGINQSILNPNGTCPTTIVTNTHGLGVKMLPSTVLFEAKPNGNFMISGSQYGTSGGSVAFGTGQVFDGFDVAECVPCDADYENGTVVCPHDTLDVFTKCSHDNCAYASIISISPGFLMGEVNHTNFVLPVALSGRVYVSTALTINKKQFVVSNGLGGVRLLNTGEAGHTLGFAINASANGQVGIFTRSSYMVGV